MNISSNKDQCKIRNAMKFPTILFTISMTVIYCHAGKLNLSSIFSHEHEITRNCTEPGLFCESCSSLVTCILDFATNTMIKVPRDTCKYPFKCVNGECTTDPDPSCDPLPLCKKVGIFPDPVYCNKFVICVQDNNKGKLQPYLNECLDGYGYNVKTTLCDIKLDQNRDPITQCPHDK